MLDRNLRYVSLNRRLAIMNRLPAEAHLGRTPEEIIPDVFRQVEERMHRALAGETIEGVEIRKPPLETGKGDQVLMASYLPVRDEAGEVIGVSVAIMDVSEYRHTEEALRETRHHYGNMVKLNPHVQWVMNARGEVIGASPRWEEITGQPLEQALGRGFMNALHPDDVDPTDAVLRKALETGTPIDVKFRAQLPQGGWRWLRSRGLPLLSDSGELIAIYGVVEDPDGDGPNKVA
jgi:PAS domain S-box-containing protein